jgi:hypothetical protein
MEEKLILLVHGGLLLLGRDHQLVDRVVSLAHDREGVRHARRCAELSRNPGTSFSNYGIGAFYALSSAVDPADFRHVKWTHRAVAPGDMTKGDKDHGGFRGESKRKYWSRGPIKKTKVRKVPSQERTLRPAPQETDALYTLTRCPAQEEKMNSPFNVFMQAELMRLKKASAPAPAPAVQSLPRMALRVFDPGISPSPMWMPVHAELIEDCADAGGAGSG